MNLHELLMELKREGVSTKRILIEVERRLRRKDCVLCGSRKLKHACDRCVDNMQEIKAKIRRIERETKSF